MKLLATPLVHSARLVEVPVVVLKHSSKAHQRWKNAQIPWSSSGYTNDSGFGRYRTLARTGRFRFPKGRQASYKFGEFHVALHLHRNGYQCWSAVHLFKYGKKKQFAEFSTHNTEDVQDRWRKFPWPGDIQQTPTTQPGYCRAPPTARLALLRS